MGTDTAEQPAPDSAPSLEDRLAGSLGLLPETAEEPAGEQPTEEAADSETPAEPTTFELEVDGKKYSLPKELEKGFLQEKDYTQKSQSLADTQRLLSVQGEQLKIASAESQFQQSIAPELQQLGMLESLVKQANQLDWASMPTDELMRKRMELDSLKDQRDTLAETIQGKQQEWGAKQVQALNDLRAKGMEVLKKAVPTWNEETSKAVKAHALANGYTDSEVANIFDPRHALTLYKAMQFDQLKAKATPAVAQAKNVKPGASNPMSQKTKDDLAYRKAIKATEGDAQARKSVVEGKIARIFGG
jgi:hypothetical protein